MQMDQFSLGLWVNTDHIKTFSEISGFCDAQSVLEAITEREYDHLLLQVMMAKTDEEKSSILRTTTEYSHEKRHYYDLLFHTSSWFNWQLDEHRLNLLAGPLRHAIEACKKKTLAIPLSVYSSPMTCRKLGVETTSLLKEIGKSESQLKHLVQLDHMHANGFCFGSSAHLEALALQAQLAAGEEIFGQETNEAVFKSAYGGIGKIPAYTHIHRFMLHTNLGANALTEDNKAILDGSLLQALCIVSLNGRYPILSGPIDGDIVQELPSSRFVKLVSAIRKIPSGELWLREGKRIGFQPVEAFEFVDKIASEIFGFSTIENIENDIQNVQKRISADQDESSLGIVLNERNSLRIKLLEDFKNNPVDHLDPNRFFKNVEPRLCPVHISCSPKGTFEAVPSGVKVILQKDLSKSGHRVFENLSSEHSTVTWAFATPLRSPRQVRDPFLPGSFDSWVSVASHITPMVRFLRSGFAEGSMLGAADVFGLSKVEKTLGVKTVIHPMFSRPMNSFNGVDLAEIFGNAKFRCSFSDIELSTEHAVALTRWDFENLPDHWDLLVELFGRQALGPDKDDASSELARQVGLIRAETDWSTWLVCPDAMLVKDVDEFRGRMRATAQMFNLEQLSQRTDVLLAEIGLKQSNPLPKNLPDFDGDVEQMTDFVTAKLLTNSIDHPSDSGAESTVGKKSSLFRPKTPFLNMVKHLKR